MLSYMTAALQSISALPIVLSSFNLDSSLSWVQSDTARIPSSVNIMVS
jgi:hypothetical protein